MEITQHHVKSIIIGKEYKLQVEPTRSVITRNIIIRSKGLNSEEEIQITLFSEDKVKIQRSQEKRPV